jgi:hypothetical protein
MSSQHFRLIQIKKMPRKLNLNQLEAKQASETALIPDGNYLFPLEWEISNANGSRVQKFVISTDSGN